ncbi:GSCOCG00009802001-RA-CDS [Cotesia congregata]|uniref:Uncharacterized protein n=1 Tax=Cotesia congregata TaxID=51543 RepID=A0A8J2HCH4_COTCN|nr:GSCOCG00009802001-RA-CDS [Cotesia congregata]CAG5088419.1 Protein of unknown function [Cotesia congregata]
MVQKLCLSSLSTRMSLGNTRVSLLTPTNPKFRDPEECPKSLALLSPTGAKLSGFDSAVSWSINTAVDTANSWKLDIG